MSECVGLLSRGISADVGDAEVEGVTDSGLSALASAGCGAQLTSLNLSCE